MGLASLFLSPAGAPPASRAAAGAEGEPAISGFLTVQSLSNFALVTGAISAAWRALQVPWPGASSFWVPYGFALAFGVVSLVVSWEGLRTPRDRAVAVFIAAINSLVLAGAVVGANVAAG